LKIVRRIPRTIRTTDIPNIIPWYAITPITISTYTKYFLNIVILYLYNYRIIDLALLLYTVYLLNILQLLFEKIVEIKQFKFLPKTGTFGIPKFIFRDICGGNPRFYISYNIYNTSQNLDELMSYVYNITVKPLITGHSRSLKGCQLFGVFRYSEVSVK